MVVLYIQLSAVLQLLYLPLLTGAALYTTVCSTTATVPAPPNCAALYTTVCSTTATVTAPPHLCCSLYISLQYYGYRTCSTRLVPLSIQLSAVLQVLYLPHHIGAALYTTVCSTTATVPNPPNWCCSLYNSLQYIWGRAYYGVCCVTILGT